MGNLLTRNKRDNAIVTVAILAIVIVILLSFSKFSSDGYNNTLELNMVRLEEYTLQNAFLIKNKMEDAQAYVESAAVALSYTEDILSEESFEMLDRIAENSHFNRMWIVTQDGICRSSLDTVLDISKEEYFKDIHDGNSGISQIISSAYNREDTFLIYSPIIRDGVYIGSLMGAFEVNQISMTIEMPRFNGEGYAHILQDTGEIVIESKNDNRIVDRSNAWDFYQEVEYEKGYSYEQFYENVHNDVSGFIAFKMYGKERIAHYRSVGINNWFIISIVPKQVIVGYSKEINHLASILLIEVFVCFFILVIGIVYYFNKTQKELLKANKQLHMGNERLRIAVGNTSNDVIEYDIEKNKIFRILDIVQNENYDEQVDLAAEKFYYVEMIDPQYRKEFEQVLVKLQSGDYTASCVLKLQQSDGTVYWNQLIFTNIYDETRKPVRAIGTIEDITLQRETEFRYIQEEQHRSAMLSKVITTYVFNLTKNHYMYGFDSNNQAKEINIDSSYNRELLRLTSMDVHPEDHERVLRELSLERFKREFESGNRKVDVEYRWLIDGVEQWVNCSTNLLVNPANNDVLGYSYIEDITEDKLNEMALRYDAERDLLTGLLNRQTINRLITDFLKEPGNYEHSYHAYLLIDLDKFKQVNDTYGHMAGDELLSSMANKLMNMFRNSDLIGRLGGDEFVIFLKDSRSREYIEERAQEVCYALKKLRISADPEYRISGSVGVSIVPSHGIAVEDLYRKADKALYVAKDAGRDQYKIYHYSMEEDS